MGWAHLFDTATGAKIVDLSVGTVWGARFSPASGL
jgi:hypothetical protein